MSRPQLDRSTREVELGLDYGTPSMNLAGQSLKFENGQWIAGELTSCHLVRQDCGRTLGDLVTAGFVLPPETGISGGVDRREAQRLRRRNQQLEEENNLLRLKVDILLDMVRKVREGPPRVSSASSHRRCCESKDTKPNQTVPTFQGSQPSWEMDSKRNDSASR